MTGKPAGDDLAEGKRTVLLALARRQLQETGRTAELAELDAGIGAAGRPEVVLRLQEIVSRTTAVASIEQQITELVADGVRALDGLPVQAVAGLARLATRATDRRL